MKKRFILLFLGVLLAGYLVRIPSVSAFTADHLTITPGADGEWDIGGYDFNGTGYATKGGFTPLDGASAYSWIFWARFDDVTTSQLICGQWEDALNQARCYIVDDALATQVGSGISVITLNTGDIDMNPDALQMVTVVWDKNDDSGKISIWSNTTEYVSETGVTGSVSSSADWVVGANHGFIDNMEGSLFSLRLFNYKLPSWEIADYYAMGPDYDDPILWHYWDMNEGSASTMFDYVGIWRLAQEVNFTLDMPNWFLSQEIAFNIIVPIFEGGLNVIISLGGLALIPISTGYLAKGGRSELNLKKLETFFFLFFIGWAMFLGAILS